MMAELLEASSSGCLLVSQCAPPVLSSGRDPCFSRTFPSQPYEITCRGQHP